jgi:spore coat polysaccharide biosynthesis protein SpsF
MVLAVVQARSASTRLPGKVMLPILGKPMIFHLLDRLSYCHLIDRVVVATTDTPADDALAEQLRQAGTFVFRGSENDVLDRFYRCSLTYKPDVIVRVTADDPLKDPGVIDSAIRELREDPALDYCSNTIKPTFPEGIDIEAFRFSALERAHREAKAPAEREHVTPYIWNHKEAFSVKNMVYSENLSSWRLTVDKPADFELISRIFAELYPGNPRFSLADVVDFLKNNPELLQLNAGTIRNEGYLKSLKESQK